MPMSRLTATVVALSLLLPATLLAQPSLTHATPQAVVVGKTTELKLHGAKLSGGLRVWTSFPAQAELVIDPKVTNVVTCKLTPAADVGVSVGGLIVGSEQGLSDPIYVMVDDLTSVGESGNNSAATAQALTLPVAVDGASNGATSDFYKLTVQAQQRISVEVLAQRIGSAFDPVVQLLDQNGNELALADDDEALGADCRFQHTFAAAGEYLLKVTDNKYAAGGRYRLRVGDFPIISTPFPLAGRAGATQQFTFAGEATQQQILHLPQDTRRAQLAVNAKRPEGTSAAVAIVAVSANPEIAEVVSKDGAEAVTPVVMPCGVNGRFETANDVDTFEFAAVSGQRLTLDAISRSVGSPAIVSMRILKPDGGVLGQTSASDDDEERLSVTFPADGTYRLVAEELLHRGGPTFSYRIVARMGPAFDLSIKNDAKLSTKFVPFVGNGAFAVELQCARLGYDGPIQVALADDVTGLQLYNALIPAKATTHRVYVAVTPAAKVGDLHTFGLIGRASDGTAASHCRVSTVGYLRVKTPLVAYPPNWKDGLFALSVAAEGAPYFALGLDKKSVQVPQGGAVELVCTLERKDKNFKAGITFLAPQLPVGVSHAVKQDKDVYKVTLTAAADAAIGQFNARWQVFGEINNRGQMVSMEVPVEVIKPAGVAQAK